MWSAFEIDSLRQSSNSVQNFRSNQNKPTIPLGFLIRTFKSKLSIWSVKTQSFVSLWKIEFELNSFEMNIFVKIWHTWDEKSMWTCWFNIVEVLMADCQIYPERLLRRQLSDFLKISLAREEFKSSLNVIYQFVCPPLSKEPSHWLIVRWSKPNDLSQMNSEIGELRSLSRK